MALYLFLRDFPVNMVTNVALSGSHNNMVLDLFLVYIPFNDMNSEH